MSIYVDIEKNVGNFKLRTKFEVGNETLSLLGASGCGKSMTLRCIAGVERVRKGKIVLDGKTLFDSAKRINLPPQQRHTGLLFQNYALFPNMTVAENVAVAAKREKDTRRRKEAIEHLMSSFGLTSLAKQYPSELSGGQAQRVALARILMSQAQILLLDEPFSALDKHLRFTLEQEMRTVIREFGKTVILVSHDRDEVFRMSDKIAIMKNGQIEQFDSREKVFKKPLTKSAAILTGCKNISPAKKLSNNSIYVKDWDIELKLDNVPDNLADVGIRLHDICLSGGENEFTCSLVEKIENPFSYTLLLQIEGSKMKEPLGIEIDKPTLQTLDLNKITISIPQTSVIYL